MTVYVENYESLFAECEREARVAASSLLVAAVATSDTFDAYVPGPSVDGHWPTIQVHGWRLDSAGNYLLGTDGNMYRRRTESGSIYRLFWTTPGYRSRTSDFEQFRRLLPRAIAWYNTAAAV